MEDSEKPENCESRKRSREEDEGEEKPEEVEEVSAKRPNNQPSSTVYFKLLVPSSAAGAIIGKGGDTINQLQADTATNIKMSKGGDFFPGTTDRVCMVIGSLENVRKVHSFLLDKVKEKPDATGSVGDAKAKIVVPNSTASLIIGKSGDNINHIKERTNAFIQVSPKSTNTEKPLSERVITISGDRASCEMAVDMILEKIVDDPQSGTCTNISYTDGPILPQSSITSLFATNLTSSLHLPVTGHPAMDALKFILRAKGYNEAATREVTAAMYTLASYGFIQLRTPAIPTMTQQEWPTSSAEGLASAAAYYAQAQGREANNASSAATNTSNQTQDQSNYANYYNSFYNNSGNYGNGYNAGGSYDNSYANTNYNAYGNSGMQSGMQDMSGYSSGMGQGNYPSSGMAQGNYPSSGMAQGNYPMGSGTASTGGGNYSMASGGYQGGMGEFGAQGSGGPPAPPNNDASMARQEVDVAENVLQAMMGAEGKGIMEIQQWCGVTIEVVQKAQFMHTVKVMGPQNSVQSALYIIQQYVQHAEYKRYYEGQSGQQQPQQQQQQGSHQ